MVVERCPNKESKSDGVEEERYCRMDLRRAGACLGASKKMLEYDEMVDLTCAEKFLISKACSFQRLSLDTEKGATGTYFIGAE